MDKYEIANQRLFELQCIKGLGSLPMNPATAPRYCQDDAAAFRLMTRYDLLVSVEDDEIETSVALVAYLFEKVANHPDKETAVRYSIVQTAIKLLEA